MMPKTIRIPIIFLLILAFQLLSACSYQTSISQSEDAVELDIRPREMQLMGFTQATSRRFRLLFFGFGEKNSFLNVERQALEAGKAELLIGRLRLKSYEGLLIPSLWFQAFGFEGASDFPIVGWEIYTVTGTGVRMLAEK
jgi:hypothetical protein